LKYAFAIRLVKNVIEADEKILPEEVEYYHECFPVELLEVLGLSDPEEQERLYAQAVEELPSRLGDDEKLDLIGIFLGAGVSDGDLEFREFSVVEAASAALGIPLDRLVEYIDGMFGRPTSP
jgi:uncharacterized tellurite resistance protein B-like protein